MTAYNRDKWKSKIDPNFDKVVKTFVDFLSTLEASPTEGRLTLPEEFIEATLEKPDLSTFDPSNLESSYDLFEFIQKSGGITEGEFSVFFDLLNTLDKQEPDEIINICTEIVKSLPEEESRAFYNNKLEYFKGNIEKDKEDLNFGSVIISILIRYLYTILFDENRDIVDDDNYLIKSNVLGILLNSMLSNFSQMAHQATLAELKENIIKGDEKSIFKAVQIDKSFLFLDEIKEKVLTAQLSGDAKFLKKLGKSIAEPPLQTPRLHGKTFAILQFFWPHGLYKLTYEELYNFLVHCGLNPPEYPNAFQKFIIRNIKPLYSF